MYKELPSPLNFPDLEKEILEYWEQNDVFRQSIENRDPANSFVFYEGPPTANGKPGIHHIISRTIKDFVCRFKTMQGFRVERKAGWDTHGLPVEIEVEKQLGFSSKEDIENYGIARFNDKCRESVWKYKKEWDENTRRIGFWLDLENPYITYENSYIESVWWILSELWKKDLIYRSHKILPYCPRCETPLSSHEVSQGYRDVEDPSVYVRMPLRGEEKTSFLVWTTTPWTLVSNVALALHPEIEYVKVDTNDEFLILAKSRLGVIEEPHKVVEEYLGKDLVGIDYERPFRYCQSDKRMQYTVEAGFVSTEDGSGIVHMAPAFGEDDYKMGLEYDLPVFQPVDSSGKFTDEITDFRHKFVKDADAEIIENLKNRGFLFKSEKHLHSYPHCWRCSSPLLYYARKSWFIRTTALKDRLVNRNKEIAWYPKEVGEGRFGEWLENNVDWSLSRDRYWGTPLPIWTCSKCEEKICIGSIAELKERAGYSGELDLHKPYVDELEIRCQACGGLMERTPEVIDVWFDSGSMPIAQLHYPFENKEVFEKNFPADFISEGVDQTRGWFYSLLAIAAMLFDKPCYRACLSSGLILDKDGQKMSKSKGNTVDPASILDEFGADATRWYLLAVSPPWAPTRFDPEGVGEVLRKFFGTLINVYSFFAIYANVDKFEYDRATIAAKDRSEIDRWLLSKLNGLIARVEEQLARYDLTKAARGIADFVVDDLSNWYVRRCRRRFWKSEMGDDKRSAYETLFEVLQSVTKLIAPFSPFLSDELYLNLTIKAEDSQKSVHLCEYPSASAAEYTYRDIELEQSMDLVRRVVFLGRSLRNKAGVKVRKPLAKIIVVANEDKTRQRIEGMNSLVLEELNVKEIGFAANIEELTIRTAVPQFKQLGPKFGKDVNKVAEVIRNLAELEIQIIKDRGAHSFQLGDEEITIELQDIEILTKSADGLVVTNDDTLSVALDTRISEDLFFEGLAREFVNRVQNMRKNAGFEVVDRIKINYKASADMSRAIDSQSAYIRNETLAEQLQPNSGEAIYSEEWEIDGIITKIGIEKI